jgi:hypothetical protein
MSCHFPYTYWYITVLCRVTNTLHCCQASHILLIYIYHKNNFITSLYRVIHKSLQDFQPLRYSSWDGHTEGEHVNRGRDTPSFSPTLQVLNMSTLDDISSTWQTFLAHARQFLPMTPASLLQKIVSNVSENLLMSCIKTPIFTQLFLKKISLHIWACTVLTSVKFMVCIYFSSVVFPPNVMHYTTHNRCYL